MADGEFYPTDEIIGVVNIDSRRKSAFTYYGSVVFDDEEGTTLRKEVEEALDAMSLTCSWIMS